MSNGSSPRPKISVVVLNYNGQAWLPRCFESLESQTIFKDIEVIIVDNNSPDGSARLADEWVLKVGRGKSVKNRENLYFCEGNNRGAEAASGDYLFFLNNDTWLEPNCLEVLLRETQMAGAVAATPIVLNYEDSSFQSIGSTGLDLFGMITIDSLSNDTSELFAACGCSYLVKTDVFRNVGGFDAALKMYSDEADISWRVLIAGGRIVGVPASRLHHRGAATANPEGKTRVIESRTSETKRYLANRNGVLLLLKNSQHVLLLLLLPHMLLLLLESIASLLIVRRWSYVRKSYFVAVMDAFRMMPDVRKWRRQIRSFRRRGDFWMMRFLRLRPSRWDEVKRLMTFGAPKVEAK
jgi:GT2 family glycosyltransferase